MIRKLAILIALTTLVGCSTAEKYAANQAAATQWLDESAGRPTVAVNGAWEALEYGWGGAGRLVQTGNRITGTLGNYTVRGVVNGAHIFLAFDSNGWTYYTAKLRKVNNTMGGFYSSEVPFRDTGGEVGSLTLRRIGD